MRKLLFMISLVTLTVSCNKEQMTDRTFSANATVCTYVSLNRSNEAMMGNVISAVVSDESLTLALSLVGGNSYSVYSGADGDELSTEYRQLRDKYGDNNPTASVFRYYKNSTTDSAWRIESGNCIYYCISDKIDKITITSDRAWDENHPVGSELNDLFTVEFSSLAEYIGNGFSGTTVAKHKQVLSDINSDNYALLYIGISGRKLNTENISFATETLPTDYKQHNIKITLTLDSKEEIEYTTSLSNL